MVVHRLREPQHSNVGEHLSGMAVLRQLIENVHRLELNEIHRCIWIDSRLFRASAQNYFRFSLVVLLFIRYFKINERS